MSQGTALLPEFDLEMAGTRRTLERVPENQGAWSPHPKSFSLDTLANHVAGIPGWLPGIFQGTGMDFADPEVVAQLPPPVHTRRELLARFDEGAAAARKTLQEASEADYQAIWTARNEGKEVFALPRIAVYRSFVLNHLIHHRAQLGVYLRLLDQPVPGLYGPSADEA